jgi:hypothetical protein
MAAMARYLITIERGDEGGGGAVARLSLSEVERKELIPGARQAQGEK